MTQAYAILRTAYVLHIPYRWREIYEEYAGNLGCCHANRLPVAAYSQGNPAPADAFLYISGPLTVRRSKVHSGAGFALRNMGVTQAGSNAPNSGHHHLLIDVNEPLEPNEPIPQDKTHLHFGAGQTEARIELPPGRHTLQLVLGDAKHYPFNPPVISKKITITGEMNDARRNRHAA